MKITAMGLVRELQQLYQTDKTAARMMEGTLRHYFDSVPGGQDRVEAIIDLLEQTDEQEVEETITPQTIVPLIRTHNRYFDRVAYIGSFTDAMAIR